MYYSYGVWRADDVPVPEYRNEHPDRAVLLEVRKEPPSRLRLMCRSARAILAPMVRSMSSGRTGIRFRLRATHVQLHLFDWRHRLWNAIVGLFHRGKSAANTRPRATSPKTYFPRARGMRP